MRNGFAKITGGNSAEIKEEPNETWEACEKKSKISLRINWE